MFNIEQKYILTGWRKYLLFIPNIIFAILFIYIVVFSALIAFFNPAVLIIIYYVLNMILNYLKKMRFIVYEKSKIKIIKEILQHESNTVFCKENKIKWNLGLSGYWIEVIKIKD